MEMREGLIFRFLLIAFAFFAISFPAHAVFNTPGKFEVGPDGSANYDIPIQVPPGTAGMTPKLSLNYNSQTGNSFLGLGWGVDGLSQITRCPKTLVQDGIKGGVNFDTNDRFCLDGQRLVVATGSYGANGAEYRTELANFAKIVSYGTAGNGPAWFKVWTKSGQIIEYGNTEDSRIEAQGKPTVMMWGVNKISDTKGNYILTSYMEDNANGEAYINRVDYTGNINTGLTPYASVRFSYETRPDTSTGYQAGSVIKTTKRITNIKTYTGDVVVKDYRFTYTNNGAYNTNTSDQANGSLMQQIQECDGAATTTCQMPTVFNWTPGIVDLNPFSPAQNWTTSSIVASGDVNGDGRADIIYQTATPSSGNNTGDGTPSQYLALSTGTGFSGTGVVIGTWTASCASMAYGSCVSYTYSTPTPYLGDLNGDGRADVVINGQVRLSTGNNFGPSQNWLSARVVSLADINGDGKDDVLYDVGNAPTSSTNTLPVYAKLYVAFSSGSGFSGAYNTGINGGVYTCTASLNNACTAYKYSPPAAALGDVNGDGLADVLIVPGVHLSNGTAFSPLQNWLSGRVVSVADINGDGKADILYDVGDAPSGSANTLPVYAKLYVAFSSGTGFSNGYNTGINGGVYTCTASMNNACTAYDYTLPAAALGDVNGDGLSDVVSGNAIRLSASAAPDRLTSIIGGLNETHSLIYKKLIEAGVYVPDTDAIYPIRDLLPVVPTYVVSSVSSSDGIGSTLTTNYSYGGLKADLNGRGSLGFRWVKTSTPDSDIAITSFYRQDYPYIGLSLQTEQRTISGNILLSVNQQTYANNDLITDGATSKFPHVSQTVEQNYELDGSLVNSTTTANAYDAYGNLTQVTVTTHDGYVKTTNNTYSNDVATWILGRLIKSSVTSTAPTQLPVTPPAALALSINPTVLTVNSTTIGPIIGTASLSATGGTGPYTYSWSRVTGTRINVSGTEIGSFEASLQSNETVIETYRATVTDAVGGTASADLEITFTTPAAFTFNQTITANTVNYNLKAAAIAAGWNQTIPLNATITVNSGIYLSASSTANYAFDTGAGFPTGTTLQLVNNGNIVGRGGNGGNGGTSTAKGGAGGTGGPALRAQALITITNNGVIGGGGGGGGGGSHYQPMYTSFAGGGGGGGRGGSVGGTGGNPGGSGSLTAAGAGGAGAGNFGGNGGSGGGLGAAGAAGVNKFAPGPGAGGAGGSCTVGNANITWTAPGSRYGALN